MRKIQSLFLIVLSLPACSFLKAPPTTANQQDAIAAAVTVAVPACLQLGKAIKPGEVDKLRASLVFVGAALQADGERAELAINALMTSNDAAAPYAPVVAAIVQLAINRVPEDARKSTAAEIGKGVVSGCLVGLGQAQAVARFRKRPVVIEAILYSGHNGREIEGWSKRAVIESPVLEPGPDNPTGAYLQIETLEGAMIGNVGDWIIRGVKGEFYPCKPDIFAATYEPAE